MCSATTTAYSEVGCCVSLPLGFEERSLLRPKEHGRDSSFKCQIWRENAVSCLALHKVGDSVRAGRAVFNEVRFSLAGCPEEHRNCGPDTLREARRRWKLKALFTFPVSLSRKTRDTQVPWQHLAHFPLLKADGKHPVLHQQERCLCLCGWQSALGRHSALILNWALVLCCARTCKFIFTSESHWCS